MKRPRARHLLFLIALLHLAADMASAGGMVFCVGPDDHRALETEHLAGAGCELPSAGETTSLNALASDCTDSPLHPDADIAAGSQPPARFSLALLALPSRFATHAPLSAPAIRTHQRAPDLNAGLSRRRTTVLLL